MGLSHVQVAGERVYWNESRPAEGGRLVVVCAAPDGSLHDALPAGWSTRSAVHEYGGRCYALHGATLVFSNWEDQRLWARAGESDPYPLTPAPASPRGYRFADPVVTPDGRWVICVRQRHGATVDNDLVAVALRPPPGPGSSPGPDPPRRLAGGHDFFSAPRLSPDGRRLAWVTWDHPDMPWDSTVLWVADIGADATLGSPRLVAGGPGESVTQPRWSPDAALWYVSDRSGWWNLYDEHGRAACPMEAEFGQPDWAFGAATYAFLTDGRLVAAWSSGGTGHLGVVGGRRAEPAAFPFSTYSSVQAVPGGVVAVAASPTEVPAVVRLGLDDGSVTVLRRSRNNPDPAYVSAPRHLEYPTSGGQVAHALHYPPANADFAPPPGELPPLVVTSHGGPTSCASTVLDLGVQYWTSRGFAVADVDYRGSSGYGRAYRQALRGAWGVADVEDCAAVVSWLSARGEVDGTRAVIRGGSAGGFTTLAALVSTDVFAAGSSAYGLADLEAMARDTHKFEARYMDGLVGPYPAEAAEYRRRSPIHHVERISCPLILFQGLDDPVVPPVQSEMMYQALAARGIPVTYVAFEGEEHGFRRAATIRRVAEAELAFYGRVLGFTPAGRPVPLTIVNEAALARA